MVSVHSACLSRLGTSHILHLLPVFSYALLEDEVRAASLTVNLALTMNLLGQASTSPPQPREPRLRSPARKSSVAHRKPEAPAYPGRGAWLSGERVSPLDSSTRARFQRSGLKHGGAVAVGGAATAAPPGLGACVREQVSGASGPGRPWRGRGDGQLWEGRRGLTRRQRGPAAGPMTRCPRRVSWKGG